MASEPLTVDPSTGVGAADTSHAARGDPALTGDASAAPVVEDNSVAGEEDPGASLGATFATPDEVYRPTPVAPSRPAAGEVAAPSPSHQGVQTMEKSATVHWEGAGKQGQGQISSQTGAFKRHPYGFASRFEDDRRGTNPEEILAAAHAACFTMAFSFACDKAGFATRWVDTRADVRLVQQGEGFLIDRIALRMSASVPGLDQARFQQIAEQAKRDCPLSKALAGVADIALQAVLNGA